jgi:hypothetical protein
MISSNPPYQPGLDRKDGVGRGDATALAWAQGLGWLVVIVIIIIIAITRDPALFLSMCCRLLPQLMYNRKETFASCYALAMSSHRVAPRQPLGSWQGKTYSNNNM